jgi:hypothetical protein
LEERAEIEEFIKKFADNASTYDYTSYLDMVAPEVGDTFPTELTAVK